MFARTLTMQLKPNTAPEFTRLIDSDLIPMLRKNRGFRDELVFVNPGATSAVVISLWDSRENAENYALTTYPEVLKSLSKVIDGTPRAEMFQVTASTLHGSLLAAKA